MGGWADSRMGDSAENPPIRPSAQLPKEGRLLGVDWGQRRIGLALSDESQILAQPLTTLTRRTGKRFPMSQLLTHIATHEVRGVVVGLPLDQHGDEGEPARAARTLAEDIQRRTGRPVALWDERFTTAKVRTAIREAGGVRARQATVLDALAATVLLQHYLDARRGRAT
jgi:putative Holliday junction resolvase